jgi:PAS domain S-box-containing protein
MLVTAAAFGYPEDAIRDEISVGRGVMGRVAATGNPVLVSDVADAPDYLAGIQGARSELAVPLVARERVIGVFNVESPRPGAFSEDDIPPLMAMAAQAAMAIENARLYRNLCSMSGRYEELHQLNDRILKSVNLGIYTVDEHLVITSWNRRMEDMSGVARDRALGRGLFELFPGLEDEGFGERVRRVLQRGTPEKLRLTHRNFKGQTRIQKRRLAPLKDGERTTGAVVIVEDITEFKRLLEQTIQSEKLAEVGRLSAGIAHEVNNPLAVISYAAQLLQREQDLPEFQQELVERIESEAERLKALTGSLLSFSRSREMVRQEIDLNEVLRDVLRLVRYELSRNGIELREEYQELPDIHADPNKLKQVFINLIMNAAQAMGEGGTLTVATAPVAGAEVEAIIADTGPGIPEAVREQIFDPFFSTKKEGEGTGLGLYISRNIVVEHEGRLLFKTGSSGTTFRVVLPTG